MARQHRDYRACVDTVEVTVVPSIVDHSADGDASRALAAILHTVTATRRRGSGTREIEGRGRTARVRVRGMTCGMNYRHLRDAADPRDPSKGTGRRLGTSKRRSSPGLRRRERRFESCRGHHRCPTRTRTSQGGGSVAQRRLVQG